MYYDFKDEKVGLLNTLYFSVFAETFYSILLCIFTINNIKTIAKFDGKLFIMLNGRLLD